MVEMLGRYSHLCEQGERLDDLLEMVPEGSPEAFPQPPLPVPSTWRISKLWDDADR
jgi:hypothetical protein